MALALQAAGQTISPRRRGLILAVLTAAICLSYVDRYLLAVLLQPIKADFGLSDSEIGLLSGFAFVVFYVLAGVPVARLADKGFRRSVIVGSILVWSAMTALTGAATSFWHLAAARFGVGAGEGGVMPTSQAIVAGLYPPERRTPALAILASGGSIGLLIAFAGGARMEAAIGWRATFMAMLIPGAIFALLAAILLPKQPKPASVVPAAGPPPAKMLANPHFRHLPIAQALIVLLLFGHIQWLPAFFERSFGASRGQVGAFLGVSQAGGTLLGAILGAYLIQRLAKGYRARLRWVMGCVAVGGLTVVGLYASPAAGLSYGLAALAGFLLSAPSGVILSHLQSSVRQSERATAAAAAIVVASVIGLGAGPALIGLFSDLLNPRFGVESLRYGVLIVVVGAVPWALFHLWRLQRLPQWDDGRPVPFKRLATDR